MEQEPRCSSEPVDTCDRGDQAIAEDQRRTGLQSAEPWEVYTTEPSDIVIGLVGLLGTDHHKMIVMLQERLKLFGYQSDVILISKRVIPAIVGPEKIPTDSEFKRSEALINFGNQIRRVSNNPAVLAIAAAAEIGRCRPTDESTRNAYIISSLKHPEEVAELRKIYRNGFYLFALHTDRDQRMEYMTGQGCSKMTEAEALALITRDEHEPEKHGQQTRDTFALADFFCADERNDDKLRYSVIRCLDLVFCSPRITPTFNEFAMFMAFASSLRSADLSRQVGAVVARGEEILSTGANDCPKPGGGLYWPEFIGDRIDDVPRGRDYKRGCESNTVEKQRLLTEITSEFDKEMQKKARTILENSSLMNITEYGRVVHAEMEALLACARSNVSCVGATLYCTTFPCHNCAKHIIAAGIDELIYIEPYPKSRALEFHDDAVTLEKCDEIDKKVRFKPFIGVGPRQFFDLFSMSLSSGRTIYRKEHGGIAARWQPASAVPRMQMLPFSHLDFEEHAAQYLSELDLTEEPTNANPEQNAGR